MKVVELFRNLLSSGFHLAEIVDFLRRSSLMAPVYTEKMQEGLASGAAFSEILDQLGFSPAVTTQVSLAERHGNLEKSLVHIHTYLTSMQTVRKKLVEVATYPLILLGFLILIMLGLKNYLLPQLEEGNVATAVINQLPLVFLGVLGGLLLLIGVGGFWYRKTAKIKTFSVLARLPFVGQLIRCYLTAYYAREWGNLIGQGMELPDVVAIMTQQRSALFCEIGKEMQRALLAGENFHDHIKKYPFFRKELALMIEYGQVKSKLGSELAVYAEECWKEFFYRLHRSMQWIQPLVFLFVALLIVLIYVAMLLPIYHNMEM